MTNVSEEVKELVEELFEFYKDDDWVKVKKFILRYSHPDTRKNFSTRHEKTKKHTLNKFETNLIKFIKSKYNIELELKDKDKHTGEI